MRPEWTKRISFENVRPLASLFSEDLAISHGAPLNLGDFGRDADDYPRMNQRPALMRLLDRASEHLLSDPEICNHPVSRGLIKTILPGVRPNMFLGFFAHRQDLSGAFTERNGRRFIDDNPPPSSVDTGVHRAQVEIGLPGQGGGSPVGGAGDDGCHRCGTACH